ncbi:MAG: N-6 DNA methylase [Thermoanaerobaculia bacterium]
MKHLLPVSTAPVSGQALELAYVLPEEEEQFREFLAIVRDHLTRDIFSYEGHRGALAQYLDARRQAGPSSPAGDEQSVVDVLVRHVLEALGYREGDFVYNRRLADMQERAVPDFTVYVEELLGRIPVLLVESKATSVRDFQRLVRSAEVAAESPLEQLRRYVLSGAVHGRIGWLCNGWKLEAWEFGAEGDTRLVQLDFDALSHAAAGEGEGAFPGLQRGALMTLWKRFSRSAFLRALDLQSSALDVPPMPPEWKERVQKSFSETGRARAIEDEILDYYQWHWKQNAIDVRQAPESLVRSLRGLIEQFAADVLHQLDDALDRRREYDDSLRRVRRESKLPRLLERLALRQQNFVLTKEDFERDLLFPVEDWCRLPRLEQKRESITSWIDAVAPHVKVSNGDAAEQMTLGTPASGKTKPLQPKNGQESGRKKIIEALRHELEDLCTQALEDFAAQRQLEDEYRTSLRASTAYQTWAERVSSSVLVGAPEPEYRREFALQTAYVYIIRLLLVRICEDKGLFRRKLSNGGLVLWQERAAQYLDYASGRSYEYLTRMAYECAQNVYVHFYGASALFDWYRMDEKMLLRSLLVLNVFDLAEIDTDIIGAVYGRYLEEGKHEQGRYYTPRPLVTKMLDMVGYQGDRIANRRLADLACGSGSFLVEACRRLLDQYRGKNGQIPKARLRPALEEIQKSIYGLELNPFACYLAETNLLIQVLDIIRRAKEEGITLAVDRFQIYSVDSLTVNEVILESPDAILLLGKDVVVPELIKARAGEFREGFDFLVGNPPYVRADEGAAYLSYRRRLEQQEWFTTRHLKWDLYVPFVEQYFRLLAEKPEARCCLVTIESISTAPYAERLREFLGRGATLHEILFVEGLGVFEDASWQDNIVFSFSKGEPLPEHIVQRFRAASLAEDGTLLPERFDELTQAVTPPERLLNPRSEVSLDAADTLRLEELCYVSKGMVLHSNERLADGQVIQVPASYDPVIFGERLVEDLGAEGKRIEHRKFRREDLIAEEQDTLHPRPYLDPRELLRGGIGHVQWIEYGEAARCPSRVSRPTFPELYDRPKIVLGTFTGVAVDDGSVSGFQVVSHSVTLAILWHRLEGVENRSLTSARAELAESNGTAPVLSENFSEWYLCSLVLSEPIQRWLRANKRSMKEHVYPDDVRAIPIKRLSAKDQRPFIALEKERHRLWRELIGLEEQGFRIGSQVEAPVHDLTARFRQEHPKIEHLTFFQIPASVLEVEEVFYDRDLRRVRAVGSELRVKGEVFAHVGAAIAQQEEVASFLAKYFRDMPGTYADRQAIDSLPRTEKGILALARFVAEQEEGVRTRQARIAEIQKEIDRRAWNLYRPS